ncbi:MAG: response regulator [Planctomycetota bacterium]
MLSHQQSHTPQSQFGQPRSGVRADSTSTGALQGSFTGFAAAIAHDLNNQLTAVLGNLSLMLDRSELDTDLREMATDSHQAAGRIQQMVRTLQTLTGQRAVRSQPVELNEVLDGISTEKLRIEPELPTVRCELDPGILGELMSSLVDRATLRGRRPGVIRLRTEGAQAVLECVDEMAPIGTKTDLRRWFDLDGRGNERGSAGLGLSGIASSAQALGGSAEAFRNDEARVCLRVVFPRIAEEDEQPVVRSDTDSLRVLVMDDDPDVQNYARRVLEDAGHGVQVVEDGALVVDAWAQAQADGAPFDVFLSDLVVPGGTGGHEALERLHARFGPVPAVAMSGHLGHPVLGLPSAFGFDAALPKPFAPSDLDASLRSAVAERMARRA